MSRLVSDCSPVGFVRRVGLLSFAITIALPLMGRLAAQTVDNGDFAKGMAGWNVFTYPEAQVVSEISPDAYEGKPALKIETRQADDSKPWLARLSKNAPPLEAGVSYTLKFFAKIEPGPKNVEVGIAADKKTVIERRKIALTPDWQEFEVNFVPGTSASEPSLSWNNLARTGSIFYLADVRIVKE